ncbi:MAG: tyrosine-type recombinase/integrase, partial [Planctomycetes bacterium]|nr:tyrosine-type recombinase/integrase [Planctomycetota bacterium]
TPECWTGRLLRPEIMPGCGQPALAEAGLSGFRFHDLRHTHASWLIDSVVDVVKVSKRLRHSRPSTTVNIYAHLIDVDESEILDALDDLSSNVEPLKRRSG